MNFTWPIEFSGPGSCLTAKPNSSGVTFCQSTFAGSTSRAPRPCRW